MALRHPGVKVEALTVVAGNVWLDRAVANALLAVEMAETYRVPVYPGAAGPFCRPLETAVEVHGRDGLSDTGFNPQHSRAESNLAVRAILDLTEEHPGEITLVALGPLTNLAAALVADPGLPQRLGEMYIMGGTGDGQGNVTPVAEYNFWVDPEAARAVIRGGFEPRLVGWDIARHYGVLNDAGLDDIRRIGTRRAKFAVDANRAVREFCREVTQIDGVDFPDPIAMAIALEPELAGEWDWVYADVETGDGLARGQLIIDWLGILGRRPNLWVCREADAGGFRRMFKRSLEDKVARSSQPRNN